MRDISCIVHEKVQTLERMN